MAKKKRKIEDVHFINLLYMLYCAAPQCCPCGSCGLPTMHCDPTCV